MADAGEYREGNDDSDDEFADSDVEFGEEIDELETIGMADAEDYKEGYDEEFVDEIDRDFECAICQLPYRDPVQLKDCGHRFCKDCITRVHR